MNDKGLLLIIPFFNEASRINEDEYAAVFSGYTQYDFVLVDDGSTDGTATVLDLLAEKHTHVKTLNLTENKGKAEAIRLAVLQNSIAYQYIGYLDADFATPIAELAGMETFARNNAHYTFIMGCRIKKMGSQIDRYTSRHYFGRVFATIVSQFILKTPVYDTQCGAKIIEAKLARTLFTEPFITRWLFDVELLLRYRQHNESYENHVYEYSLSSWIEKGNSKITVTDFIKFPAQLVKIYFHYDC